MTLSIVRVLPLVLLAACASAGERCEPVPKPSWVDKTAFELNLSPNYYYGKGEGKTRDKAIAGAQGEIALQVSANIFTRSVLQQTNEGQRAEAIAKAISDVQGRGVEQMHQWQRPDCLVYVMSRVSKKVAQTWKTRAQSYLVHRPGLGMVRRAKEEIHQIAYIELNSPPLFIEWQSSPADSVMESLVRKTLRQSGVSITSSSLGKNPARRKVLLRLTLSARALSGVLVNRRGQVLASAAQPIDAQAGKKLAESILDEWLGDKTRQEYR